MSAPNVEIISGGPAGLPGPLEAERLELRIDGVEHICLMSRDEVAKGVKRWHISLSLESSAPPSNVVPEWRNLVAVAHKLRPGVCFCVPVPPRSQWYNLHPAVLHVYEISDPDLEAHFHDQHHAAVEAERSDSRFMGITEPS